MSAIFEQVHKLDEGLNTYAMQLAFKHPNAFFFTLFIGMPIFVLVAVFLLTVLIAFPMAIILGWL